MKIAKLSFVGIASLCGLAVLADATPAFAQNCYSTHSAGFARVRSAENRATSQPAADQEVRSLFGPRIDACEEGAYNSFMNSFKEFAASAMRAPKLSRDKLLRLAIAVVAQAPVRVPAKEVKYAASLFRQVRSDLNATADDVGFAQTPLLQQLLDTLGSVGAPRASEQTVTMPAPDSTVSTPPSTPVPQPPSGGVQSVRVPNEPLPPWAVVKLYEMRDSIKAQDLGAIQIRLQDIINWIEAKSQNQ